MKIKNITELLEKAFKKEQEDGLLRMWELQFPNMTEETFITFDDYKDKFMTKKHSEVSFEDIEKEMLKVEQAFAERR